MPRNPQLTRGVKGEVTPYYDVAVLGETACGKSSIIERLVNGSFTQTYTPTAAEVHMTTLHEDNRRVACLQLFDTAGGFQFPMMLRLTITKCQAFVVVYSVDSQRSLDVAITQIQEIQNIKGKHFPCILVGSKCDLVAEREITFDKGLQTAVSYGCAYIETSSLEDKNIKDVFLSLVKKIEFTASVKRQLFREQAAMRSGEEGKHGRKRSVRKFIVNLSNSFGDRDRLSSIDSDSSSDSDNE
ncbi:GTP-binding protein Di-Ras2-like [Clytia hemisphaerica]|uniref:GTP-binding protein Di-Ras2-like n=1 Tax=Clytia hemisphaerica TaxID=252671 RepID=UPI0034D5EC46